MWETRVKPQPDHDLVVEFWKDEVMQFIISCSMYHGTAQVLTKSGHFRASLIPNVMNGLHVDLSKPDSTAAGK